MANQKMGKKLPKRVGRDHKSHDRRARSYRRGQDRKADRRRRQELQEAENRRRREKGLPTPWEEAKIARRNRRANVRT